jgi:hypothetical protein
MFTATKFTSSPLVWSVFWNWNFAVSVTRPLTGPQVGVLGSKL